MKIALTGLAAACVLALLFLCGYQAQPAPAVRLVKTPQQALAGQPRDEYHDAFLVDTGGKMGTLLVTAQRDRQEEAGPWQVRFSVWDPGDMEKPLQTMAAEAYNVFNHSLAVDANFDGHQDFGYMYAMGNQPTYYYFWLWDEGLGQFVEEPALSEICGPTFDGETQTVSGFLRLSGASNGLTSFYRWMDGRLTCVRRITVDFSGEVWDSPFLLTVEDDADGALAEVYRQEFPWDGQEWGDEWSRWCDLDYHGAA